MSEKLMSPEVPSSNLKSEAIQPKHEARAKRVNLKEVDIEKLREVVDSYSNTKKEIKKTDESEKPFLHHHYLTKHVKEIQYQKVLSQARAQLSPVNKTFSKIIHNNKIETISDLADKSIARPSGILFGGVFSLVGASIVFFLSQKIGFVVPKSIFLALFVLGFAAGVILEAVYSGVKKIFSRSA